MISYRKSFIFITKINPGDAIREKSSGNIYLYLPISFKDNHPETYLYSLKMISEPKSKYIQKKEFVEGEGYCLYSPEKTLKMLFEKSYITPPKPEFKLGDKFEGGTIGGMIYPNGDFSYRVDFEGRGCKWFRRVGGKLQKIQEDDGSN